MLGIVLGGMKTVRGNGLVAEDAAVRIGRCRAHGPHTDVVPRARDEKRAELMVTIKLDEIQIAALDDVTHARVDWQDVEHVHFLQLAFADVDKGGNGAMQIEQRVHLDCRFGLAKRDSREQRQAQVDRRGVERIDRCIDIDDIDILWLPPVQRPGTRDETDRRRMIDPPIAQVQRIRQRRTRRHVFQSHVEPLAAIGRHAHLDVAQRLSPSQLGEARDPKQIGATQGAHAGVARMPFDYAAEGLPR